MFTKAAAQAVRRFAMTRGMSSSSSAAAPELVSTNKAFGGSVARYRHQSEAVKGEMGFAVFTPDTEEPLEKLPTLYWLSGLTCDDTNFIFKAGSFEHLARHGMMLVAPDTSPRGCGIKGEDDSYDFGSGAGFYISATTPDYKENYQMYEYVSEELPEYVAAHFPSDDSKKGIFGHSMGGLGALNVYLKSGNFDSVSAFSPICNPMGCEWGKKAFTGYIGDDESKWPEWDPSELLKALGDDVPEVLVSQGAADNFLIDGQLRTDALPSHPNIDVRMEEGYDHSYYFIASFIKDHIDFHAEKLILEPLLDKISKL